MELLLLTLRLLLRINPHLRVVLMSATIEASFFGKYFAEFSEDKITPPTPMYVGNRLFDVETFHLEDLAEGKAPAGRQLPPKLMKRTAKFAKKFFPLDLVKASRGQDGDSLEGRFQPRVQIVARELVQEMIPEIAEGGSTILIFVPGYADLLRMHSWLYWNLPTVGSVNMGYVPPKPDQLPEDEDEEEEEDLDEMREMVGMEGPFAAPMPASSSTFSKPEGTAGSLQYRLFALHSQVAQEDQELVLEKPPPGICNVVLATTIAESSLTLPQVIGVIDFCIHKTSVGDPSQMGLARLMAQWCARSACLQREGRAGRTQPGWCIRMVSKMFFEECMMEYDIPEILRTPLTTLYLKAKGIADGLGKVVEGNLALAEQLRLGSGSPGELLSELLAPPGDEAINAAVHKLAQLAVLTEESANARVTVLGRLALYLPLDIQLSRLVWLGCLFGCPAEAIVLAAACNTPSPFLNPSRLGFQDQDDFSSHLRDTAEAWRFFDAGHASEPIASLRLFCAWLRRLKLTPARSNTLARWYRATTMLEKDTAIDSSKMTAFVSFVADLTIRCRDLCSDERDRDLSCRVRADLYGLVQLLRRPDKNREQQKKLTDDSYVPAIGEVFRAPASKIYALLAAAFSDTLLFGSHRLSGQEPLIDALESLGPRAASSQDAVLIPRAPVKRMSDENLAEIIETVSGFKPSQVVSDNKYIAVAFPPDEADETTETTPWVSRRHDTRTMGLGPAQVPRINGLSLAPRMCHMAAGGPRKFNVGELEFARAISPYEVEFTIMHEVRGGRRVMPGLFGEQSSLGFPCHVTDPSRLAKDHFACVASEMMLVESGQAARVNNATLLKPEEVVFVLTTICPSGMTLELGFNQGPGGSAESARASLTGLRLKSSKKNDDRLLLINRNLPAMKVMDKVNAVRAAIMENLVSPAEANSNGQEILLWEDEEAKGDFEDLLGFINQAPTIQELGGDYGAKADPVFWVRHRQRLRLDEGEKATEELEQDDEEEEEEEDVEEDVEDADIRALQPIVVKPYIESQVARKTSDKSPPITHRFECPDCADRFQDWESCREHLLNTGHLDVSTMEAENLAKQQLTKPVRWRCLECFAGFSTWAQMEEHLRETNHLAFGENGNVKRSLCKPRAIPDLDDPVRALSARLKEVGLTEEEAEDKNPEMGFFRSLRTTLSAPSSIPARQELSAEIEELVRDQKGLDMTPKLKLQELGLQEARELIKQMTSNPVPIKNPNAWLMGAIAKRLQRAQSPKARRQPAPVPELAPELEELLRDETDLDTNVKLRLQDLELEQAKELINQMKSNPVKINNRSAWLQRAIDRRAKALEEERPAKAPAPKSQAKALPAKRKYPYQAPTKVPAPKSPAAKVLDQITPDLAPLPKLSKRTSQAKVPQEMGPVVAELPLPPLPPELPPLPKPSAPELPLPPLPNLSLQAESPVPEMAEMPPLPPIGSLSDEGNSTSSTAGKPKPGKAKGKGAKQAKVNLKAFSAKLKKASGDEEQMVALARDVEGADDPKSFLNLLLQKVDGKTPKKMRYRSRADSDKQVEATLAVRGGDVGGGGDLEFVAKAATKKDAEANAARAALRDFRRILEGHRQTAAVS
ncbi:spn-E [Symbiodinium natans]|uniref:Spn-E protein n=1 Tax=Symbiodinium natans TaxID=878477 RepID=A0A812KRR6_9DINO|nr:spn-E [Symbiodinium natans]